MNLHEKRKARQIGCSVCVGGMGHGFIWMASYSISVSDTRSTFTQPAAGPAASRAVIQGSSDFSSCLPLPGDRERERDAGSPLTGSSGL